jgi:predicted transcriptional regulator
MAALPSAYYISEVANVLTIRLDGDLARALDAEAERTGETKGEVVRAALRDKLASARASALDALRDLDGIVEGPADLSTNKRHLASLGCKGSRKRSRR